MRKLSIILFGFLLMTACNNKKQAADQDDDESEETAMNADGADDLSSDGEIDYVKASFMSPDSSMVVLSAEVPSKGGTPLADSILAYLNENISYGFIEYFNETKNARKAVIKAGQSHLESVQEEITASKNDFMESMEEGDELPDYMFAWEYQQNFKKEVDADNYVTYIELGYEYQGGAHGINWLVGTTFDKQTGRRIGKEILKDTDSQAFKTMFQKELLKYFEPSEGETLSDYLLIDIDDLQISNFRIADGQFIFQYQPYEISYYAAGMPCAILSFKQMKPYLTKEGLRLIGKD